MVRTSFLLDITLRRDQVESFSGYPFSVPAISKLRRLELHPKITYFIGENGSGKSTLLEAIAVAIGMNAEGGTENFAFSTRPSHSELHGYLRIARGPRRPRTTFFFRAESYFNLATKIDELGVEGSYGGASLHEQSHGESFFATFAHRFSDRGLYLLDEPEAALSPGRQLAFLSRMHQLIQGDSQFIIATHSPILLGYPDAKILSFGQKGIEEIEYEQSDPYMVTKSFLMRREAMLAELLRDEG